jgi:hypothetical protein
MDNLHSRKFSAFVWEKAVWESIVAWIQQSSLRFGDLLCWPLRQLERALLWNCLGCCTDVLHMVAVVVNMHIHVHIDHPVVVDRGERAAGAVAEEETPVTSS